MEDENDNQYLRSRIAVLESNQQWLKDNIKLQAQEYERRLTELNHQHAQASLDRTKYLSSDLFYSKMDEQSKWRSDIDTWRARIVGIAVGAGAVSGAVAGFLMRLIK